MKRMVSLFSLFLFLCHIGCDKETTSKSINAEPTILTDQDIQDISIGDFTVIDGMLIQYIDMDTMDLSPEDLGMD